MASKRTRVEFYQTFGIFGQCWRWRMIARNGRIIAASSESFSSLSAAKRNLKLVAGSFAEKFVVCVDAD